MKDDFFDKPFDEETNVKLELYQDYLKEWAPVFLSNPQSYISEINIFDFFAGVGSDSEGRPGSPLLAIEVLMTFKDLPTWGQRKINLYLNDKNEDYLGRLKKNISELEFDRNTIHTHFTNDDFIHAFVNLEPFFSFTK